jgi:anthranilate phosphoribosyltransferase
VSNEEFYALAKAMRKYAHRVETGKYIVDSCGTGADMSGTINISTCAAILANACGANVVKQTNSSVTSECGSTDFLDALGIEICRTPEQALKQFAQHGITFVHSPYFNSFAQVNNPIRQQLGFKSVFNYLGPLINPAFPEAQLLGVSSNEMLEPCAYALQKLGTDRALVVNGLEPNIDEISVCSKTRVLELKNNEITEYFLSPEDFGMPISPVSALKGGSAAENVRIIKALEPDSAIGHAISLNAGAMIYLSGLRESIFEGVKIARETLLTQGFSGFLSMSSRT